MSRKLGIIAVAQPGHGGQFQYTLTVIQALRQLSGWDMTIYRPSGSNDYNGFGLVQRDLSVNRPYALATAMAVAAGIPLPDPFRGEDMLLAPMYTAQLLHTRVPFCYTLHDLQECYFPEYFSVYQKIWRRFLHAQLTRGARRIVCESNFVRQDIEKFLHVTENKIRVIPAPPLWEGAAETDAAQLAAVAVRYGLPQHFLFYPAQFWAHKNHSRLLEAFSRITTEFPEVQLVFTGHRNFQFNAVKGQIARLGLDDRVRHIGYVESPDILPLYRLATALVMPSLFESISIPVYEAFRAGTPVCASGVMGLAEQIGDAGVVFDPLSITGMAEAMRSLLRDPSLRSTLAKRGHEKLSSLTLQNYAACLQEMLQERD